MRFNLNNISVVLVTGGYGDTESVKTSVELLSSNGTRLCSLPNLPEKSHWHSQTGYVTCMRKSCVTFSSGRWKKTHTWEKSRSRVDHTAWASPNGVLLMGGMTNATQTTTELLNDNGGSAPSFTLKNKRK